MTNSENQRQQCLMKAAKSVYQVTGVRRALGWMGRRIQDRITGCERFCRCRGVGDKVGLKIYKLSLNSLSPTSLHVFDSVTKYPPLSPSLCQYQADGTEWK